MALTLNFPGIIDDALRYRFIRHHAHEERVRDIFSRAVDQDELQRLLDHWINEDWNNKRASIGGDIPVPTMLTVFRRDLLRLGAWSADPAIRGMSQAA